MNIAAHMVRAGCAYGTWPAVAKGGTIVRTYAEVSDRVSRLAAGLSRRSDRIQVNPSQVSTPSCIRRNSNSSSTTAAPKLVSQHRTSWKRLLH